MSTACHYPTEISDEQWDILQLLLPKPKWRPGGPGRKPLDLRRVLMAFSTSTRPGASGV
jgi:transposase